MPVKPRLIATLLVHDGSVVQTRGFKRTNVVGNALTAVEFFNGWAVDEIIVLDISYGRAVQPSFVGVIEELSSSCFVPLAVGGKVSSVDDAKTYLSAGGDKIVVNTASWSRPELIKEISQSLGSQCCVLSLDAKPNQPTASGYSVVIDNGRVNTGADALEWARQAVTLGAGEIIVNQVERDGNKQGYDNQLCRMISDAVGVPVVAMGGVGEWQHLVDGICLGGAQGAAAGNIFHFSEQSTKRAKEFMLSAGLPMRAPRFYKIDILRKARYKPH